MRSMRHFVNHPDKAFEFYLARRLGRTVEELRQTMPAAEFEEWHAFHRYERWLREHQQKAGG